MKSGDGAGLTVFFKRRTAARSAFTLVELLVVVGIIGLLAGLLSPALARAKAQAKRIHCMSNLRQMGIAAHLYAEDNGGHYPVAYSSETRDGVLRSVAWDLTTVMGAKPTVVPGLLWQGQAPLQIQQCPSFRGGANWLMDPYTGYNYNTSYIGHGENETITEPVKEAGVLRPSKTVIFGDGQYGAGADKFMRAPWPNPADATFRGRWAGTQGFRHLSNSNAGSCDGHVESYRARYVDNKDGGGNVAAGTGFLSADNAAYDLN